jgi:hypothetical protein
MMCYNALGILYSRRNFIALQSQYTTVKHSRKLLKHTYTSDLYGTGTLIPIGFFQQDLLWRSSNTHSHSCSIKLPKHTSGQSIVGLSVLLHTTTALRRIFHRKPALAPLIECLHRPRYKLTCSSRPTYKHVCARTII